MFRPSPASRGLSPQWVSRSPPDGCARESTQPGNPLAQEARSSSSAVFRMGKTAQGERRRPGSLAGKPAIFVANMDRDPWTTNHPAHLRKRFLHFSWPPGSAPGRPLLGGPGPPLHWERAEKFTPQRLPVRTRKSSVRPVSTVRGRNVYPGLFRRSSMDDLDGNPGKA